MSIGPDPIRAKPARRRVLAGAVAALAVAAGALALYGTGAWPGNRVAAECREAGPVAARMDAVARGEVAGFRVAAPPSRSPDLSFDAPDGTRSDLKAFRGRTILLNLWATWCEPCKREMPALDRLQAALGGPDFEVVAVNVDTRDVDRPRAWLEAAGIRGLAYYSDKNAGIFQDLRRAGQAEGMPTTLIIDAKGCRLGTMAGPADWASADGLALVKAALGR
jgi:thiol-disulfide isomerase/thioredoxin